jgi:hypothetical protein
VDRNRLDDILNHLKSSGFRDVTGARAGADIPISAGLINALVTASIPPNVPVREVSIRPEDGDQFSVRITPRASLLPPLTLRLAIERQPEFPSYPVLVMRMKTMGGLFGFASAALPIANFLPPGVRLEGERILVDLAALAQQNGLGEALQYVRRAAVHSENGRLILHIEAAV